LNALNAQIPFLATDDLPIIAIAGGVENTRSNWDQPAAARDFQQSRKSKHKDSDGQSTSDSEYFTVASTQ